MQTDTATLTLDLPDSLNSASSDSDRGSWTHRLVLLPYGPTVTVWSLYGDGTPEELWNDRVIGLGVVPDGAADLSPVRRVLDRHAAEILELAAMHSVEWDGANNVGRYADVDRANELTQEIHDAVFDAGAECARFWDASEWLAYTDDVDLFPADYDGSDDSREARAKALVNDARGDAALDWDDVAGVLHRRWVRVLEARAEAAELESDD